MLSSNLILRVFISATRATVKTLTQAVHVAPRFLVPRERLNVGGVGKDLLFIKALIISCLYDVRIGGINDTPFNFRF